MSRSATLFLGLFVFFSLSAAGASRSVDVVIIGAGASGIAAARALLAQNRSIVLLEASSRIGGRARSDDEGFDYGCAWMMGWKTHPLRKFAEQAGFCLIEEPHLTVPYLDGGFAPDREPELWQTVQRFIDVAKRELPSGKATFGDILPQKLTSMERLAVSFLVRETGGEPSEIALTDVAHHWTEAPEEFDDTNAIVVEGLGRLVEAWGKGLPIQLNSPVQRIRQTHDGVEVIARIADNDVSYLGKRAVITVSSDVLARGLIAFEPPLERRKTASASNLPLKNAYKKVGFRFDRVLTENPPLSRFWQGQGLWVVTDQGFTLFIPPHDPHQMIVIFSGALAEAWEDRTKEEVAAFALSHIERVLGFRPTPIAPAKVNAWRKEPYVLGSYSLEKPGSSQSRETLGERTGNLYFAGEATSVDASGSLHGAIDSGQECAERIVRDLNGRSGDAP